jgi:hypothetical protein
MRIEQAPEDREMWDVKVDMKLVSRLAHEGLVTGRCLAHNHAEVVYVAAPGAKAQILALVKS